MMINKIEFRVSIDKKKLCSKCNNLIDTKRGFIFISGNINSYKTYYHMNKDGRANLCLNCFDKFLREMEEVKKNKDKIYKKLVKADEVRVKKAVINGLR